MDHPITTSNTTPQFEGVQPSFGSSFTFLKFTHQTKVNTPYWHFHPEFEIVYIADGKGQRKVGEQMSTYEKGDLIFVGPNVAHFNLANKIDENYQEVIIQMKDHFLGKDFFDTPEMAEVKKLFTRARTGLVFGNETKWEIGRRLLKMDQFDNFSKMTELLIILQILAYAKDCTPLNVNSLAIEVKQTDQERMHLLNDFIMTNYQRKFTMDEVAAVVNMTVPSLCRFFKNLTHRTFMEYTNEFRVAKATRLLSQKDLSIAEVSYESGFNNLSHFNKQFKLVTHQTPSNYRKNLINFVEAPLGMAKE